MFYFMSHSDFLRVSAIVEVINGHSHLLSNEDSQAILTWINNGEDKYFDQFCLAVSDEWSDSYPNTKLDDYEAIANIIHSCL